MCYRDEWWMHVNDTRASDQVIRMLALGWGYVLQSYKWSDRLVAMEGTCKIDCFSIRDGPAQVVAVFLWVHRLLCEHDNQGCWIHNWRCSQEMTRMLCRCFYSRTSRIVVHSSGPLTHTVSTVSQVSLYGCCFWCFQIFSQTGKSGSIEKSETLVQMSFIYCGVGMYCI